MIRPSPTAVPISPAEHVAAIPGVTSAVVTGGRMVVGVEAGLDATTVALRAAIVLNALGAGLPVEVTGGRRTPSPSPGPTPTRWAGLSMTNAARVACAAVLAGSAGLATISNVSGPLAPSPAFLAGPAIHRHHVTPAPTGSGPDGAFAAVGAPPAPPGAAADASIGSGPAPAPPAAGPVPAATDAGPTIQLVVAIRRVPSAAGSPGSAAPGPTVGAPTTPAPSGQTPTTQTPSTPSPPPPSAPQGVVASTKPPVVTPAVTPPPPPSPESADGDAHGGHDSDGVGDDGTGRSADHATGSSGHDHSTTGPTDAPTPAPRSVHADQGQGRPGDGGRRS